MQNATTRRLADRRIDVDLNQAGRIECSRIFWREMMTHVSIRLPWHDRGWDGHVCNHPDRNPYCGGLRSVNAERIRSRDVDAELKIKGSAVTGTISPPPCTETINVFGQSAIE